MKRTLIIKLSQDITGHNPDQIEAMKAYWRATMAEVGLDLSFEVTEEDEESQVRRLLRLVRSEFRAADVSPADNEAEVDEQH